MNTDNCTPEVLNSLLPTVVSLDTCEPNLMLTGVLYIVATVGLALVFKAVTTALIKVL